MLPILIYAWTYGNVTDLLTSALACTKIGDEELIKMDVTYACRDS